jgi:hypothetical protein
MSQNLIAQLDGEQRHDLMASLRGPDLSFMEKAKVVFPAFVRGIVGPSSAAIVRTEPLKDIDIMELYDELEEVVKTLCHVEEFLPSSSYTDWFHIGGVVGWVCAACAHFFDHAESGLEVLRDKISLLPHELDHEVNALKALGGALAEYFGGLDPFLSGLVKENLLDLFLDWSQGWYPEWGLVSHDVEVSGTHYYSLERGENEHSEEGD